MTDHVGTRIGDYRIVERIGSGGMGAVYRAEHVHLGKSYAIKVLDAELVRGPDFVARFYDEARVMAELRHPHIVQVHHMGSADGVYFLVMDYVTGPEGKPLSLHEYLRGRREERLDERQARAWAIQTAEALAYAHGRGVVHRDLKPANLLIDAEKNVRLTDFGLAKAIGEEFVLFQLHRTLLNTGPAAAMPARRDGADPAQAGGGHQTPEAGNVREALDTGAPPDAGERTSGASSILGTYDYMAPEQRGEGTGRVDERTDIYSFGVLLYRMLTGRRPTAMARPVSRTIPRISRKWDVIVSRCLAEDPDARYSSAEKLLKDLRGAAGRSSRRAGIAAAWAAAFLAIGLAVAVPLMRLAQASSRQVATSGADRAAPAAADRPAARPQVEPTPAALGSTLSSAPRGPAAAPSHPPRTEAQAGPARQRARTEANGLAEALEAVRNELATRDRRIGELAGKLQGLGDLGAKAARARADMAQQRQRTSAQMAGLRKLIDDLRKELADRDTTVADLRKKIGELEDSDAEAARRHAELARRYEGTSSDVALAAKQAEMARQLEETQGQITGLEKVIQVLREEMVRREAGAEALARKIRELEDTNREAGEKQAELVTRLREAHEQMAGLKGLIQPAGDRRDGRHQASEELIQRIRGLERSSAEAVRKQSELARQLNEARTQMTHLKKLIGSAANTPPGRRADAPAAGRRAAEPPGGGTEAARKPDERPRNPSGPVISVTTATDGWARITAGRSKGIQLGMKLAIYRRGRFVSSLVIAEVGLDSAGGVLIGRKLDPLPGDLVTPSQ